MLAVGLLCASWVLKREFRRRGLDPSLSDRIAFAAVIGGIVGSKIFSHFRVSPRFCGRSFWHDFFFCGLGLVWRIFGRGCDCAFLASPL